MYPSLGRRALGRRAFSQKTGLALLAWCVALSAHGQHDTADNKKNAGAEKIYEPGGDVKQPKLVHYVEPEFSANSKEAFVEGTVKISTVITLKESRLIAGWLAD